ncbi:Protein of unknown function [Pseudomonas sp. NFACC39-1]|nr:Protein of unknown function [Pseudomonas sp. NFACC39-1]
MSQDTLTTGISTMLQKLSELFSPRRAPAGYRPGVTLEHLRRNLGLASFEQTAPTAARVSLDDGGLQLEIVERTESQLLMHLVMTEFVLRVPATREGVASFELHHTGSVRRTGIRCRQRVGDAALLAGLQAGLEADSGLQQALMPLDFKRLRIDLQARQWCLRLEHMGGSEVVNRMPAFRRYIALNREQRDWLLGALSGLQRVLRAL